MIYQAARWRKKPGSGHGGGGHGGGGGAEGEAGIAVINHAANKGDDISPDVDADSGLVSDVSLSVEPFAYDACKKFGFFGTLPLPCEFSALQNPLIQGGAKKFKHV